MAASDMALKHTFIAFSVDREQREVEDVGEWDPAEVEVSGRRSL